MKLDSGSDLKQLKVDGGMTNGDLTMSILADIGGFSVIRPEMREYVLIYCCTCFLGLDDYFFPCHTGQQRLVRRSVLELLSNFLAGI
jgi:sugar (pentulose or hexulose) kinase